MTKKTDTPWPGWANRHTKTRSPNGTNCSGSQDMARQEFKKDSDINTIVERLMRGQEVPGRTAAYGAVDYTVGLTEQYQAVAELRERHSELRAKEATQLDFMGYLEALNRGEDIAPPQPPNPEAAPKTAPEETPKAGA